jgi:hypothetical protein
MEGRGQGPEPSGEREKRFTGRCPVGAAGKSAAGSQEVATDEAEAPGTVLDSTCSWGDFTALRQGLTCSTTSHTGNEIASRDITVSDAIAGLLPRFPTSHRRTHHAPTLGRTPGHATRVKRLRDLGTVALVRCTFLQRDRTSSFSPSGPPERLAAQCRLPVFAPLVECSNSWARVRWITGSRS